jgi:hypothetical protein
VLDYIDFSFIDRTLAELYWIEHYSSTMHRLFGKPKAAKDVPPPPSLTDASSSVNKRIEECKRLALS